MNRWILGALALALAGAGCSHGSASQPSATTAQPAPPRAQAQAGTTGEMGSGKMTGMCPMAVPDTQVSAADTATGEALTFTTSSPDQVADLRSRVHAMADMHNQHHATAEMGGMHGHGGMMGEGMGSGQGGGMGHMSPPPLSTATVEDTDTGARLEITPVDPTQLAQLQSAVRAHADMMQQGRCGMMGGMPPGGMQGQ